jgi:hypothetical protein
VRRPRRLLIAAAVVTVLVLGVAGVAATVLYVRARDASNAVPVEDVIARFNAGDSRSLGGAAPRGPAPGVYLYDTTGEERVDALGGATHAYPAVTAVTVTPTACGFDERWDALEQRWDHVRVCSDAAGQRLEAVENYHEFFGRGDRRSFTCDPRSFARPPSTEIGYTWTTRCSGDDGWFTGRGETLGMETLTVGGVAVETLHYRVEVETHGGSRGAAVHENWIIASTGLVVRRRGSVDSVADSLIGNVRYQESYELRLRSLEPATAATGGD